jgi:hypothetical protein
MRVRLAALALALAFAPMPAHAVSGSGNLVNHGGPVENGSANYLIFWGLPASGPYADQLANFFRDVSAMPVYGVLGQYGVHNPSTLNGTWSDLSLTQTSLTDADVRAEVAKARAANGWPSGNGNNFFVFTPPGVNECSGSSCSGTSFCGYHSVTSGTPYAIIPYPENVQASCSTFSVPNAVPGADDAINITSHELFEILTDPLLSAWWDAAGYEVADKCAWEYGPRTAPFVGGDVTVNGRTYIVQKEYSNSLADCII